MGYFSSLASGHFQKTEDGKPLFYLGCCGPFSKPYIIETPEQETVLKKKVANFHKIFFTLFLFVIIFGMDFFYTDGKRFVLFLVLVTFFGHALMKLRVAKEIKSMKKTDSRISLHQFHKSESAKHSFVALLMRFIVSLGVVAIGFLGLRLQTYMPFILFVFAIILFGMASLGWGYALLLKLKE